MKLSKFRLGLVLIALGFSLIVVSALFFTYEREVCVQDVEYRDLTPSQSYERCDFLKVNDLLSYYVESDTYVNVYLVDYANYMEFTRGGEFHALRPDLNFTGSLRCVINYRAEEAGKYCLIVLNPEWELASIKITYSKCTTALYEWGNAVTSVSGAVIAIAGFFILLTSMATAAVKETFIEKQFPGGYCVTEAFNRFKCRVSLEGTECGKAFRVFVEYLSRVGNYRSVKYLSDSLAVLGRKGKLLGAKGFRSKSVTVVVSCREEDNVIQITLTFRVSPWRSEGAADLEGVSEEVSITTNKFIERELSR